MTATSSLALSQTYLSQPGLVCALGAGIESVAPRLFAGDSTGLRPQSGWMPERTPHLGLVDLPLPHVPTELGAHHQGRNNRLLMAAAQQIEPALRAAIAQYGAARVGIVLGTSTASVNDAITGFTHRKISGEWPQDYDYRHQVLCAPSDFLKAWLGTQGPSYTLSTACTSGARALLTARRLLRAGLCDAVICGAADSLCRLTLQGFASLEAISDDRSLPFSANRQGINIGEAATLFLMTRTPQDADATELLGGGASADGWHISAPDPTGDGACRAMQAALHDAKLDSTQIGWVNLHGTGTIHNDAMESYAMPRVFGRGVACTSTKPLTGHTLGTAGALEAAFCWIAVSSRNSLGHLPPHVWDGAVDEAIPHLELVTSGVCFPKNSPRMAMSNSFAFGGNNVSLIVGRRS